MPGIFLHDQHSAFLQALSSKLPEELKNVFIVNSVKDAFDFASKMAQLYTGRTQTVQLRNPSSGSPEIDQISNIQDWNHYNYLEIFAHSTYDMPINSKAPGAQISQNDKSKATVDSKLSTSNKDASAQEKYFDNVSALIMESVQLEDLERTPEPMVKSA